MKRIKTLFLVSLLILSVAFFSIPGVKAMYWWTNECDDVNEWDEYKFGTGTASTDSSDYVEETGSVKISVTAAGSWIVLYDESVQVPTMSNYTYYFGSYVKVTELSSSSEPDNFPSFCIGNGTYPGGNYWAGVGFYKNNSGFNVYTMKDSIRREGGSTDYALNQWLKVEVLYTTVGIDVYVNDDLEVQDSLARPNCKPTTFFLKSDVGAGDTPPNTAKFDFCYVDSERGGHACSSVEVTITNMDAGNWVFAEKKYYDFQAVYSHKNASGNASKYIDTTKIGFTDGQHWINATYDVSNETFSLESGENAVNLKAGSVTESGQNLTVVFEIYFESGIFDALDVDIYMDCNDTAGIEDGWRIMALDYFNIYNLGGRATLETSGSAGRIVGGDVFELYAQNNSWAQANMTFRKLQSVHMLYYIWVDNQRTWDDWETDTIIIKMGVDYCVNDTWLEGWSVYLEQYEGWIAGGRMRLRWNVKWFYRGVQITSEYMNSFPMVNETGDTGIPAQTSFIVDLWFRKVNASSSIGGRITSEYYAMVDGSNSWLRWATGSNWGVEIQNITQSMFFADLVDADDNIISCRQIEMMRTWVKLEQGANAHDVRVELRDYDLFDMVTAIGKMEGIDTPIFITTKTPHMPQGGFLGALWAALNGLFSALAEALGPPLLASWNTFVSFLDTIASWLGAPNFFSDLSTFIGNIIDWFADSIGYVVSLLTSTFLFLAEIMGKFVSVLSQIITQWISVVQTFIGFLDGAYTSGINVWNDLGMTNWLMVGAILYPLYLVFLWEEEGLDAVISQLKFIMDVLAMLIHGFITVIQVTINVIGRIIEAIPIVE